MLLSYLKTHPRPLFRRTLDIIRNFYEGIAFLNLARDTKQDKWRIMGENAVDGMSKWALHSDWNFGSKCKMLQAELHYLDGCMEQAEFKYRAAIKSAQEHRLNNDKALAHELFGIFYVENNSFEKGIKQLNIALEEYTKWGAMNKANELQQFIDVVTCGEETRLNSMEGNVCTTGKAINCGYKVRETGIELSDDSCADGSAFPAPATPNSDWDELGEVECILREIGFGDSIE
mmetsp:Transcript_10489/g.22621  ORF Transcript_10489/g.22621 Transcript_10489/m.22621 type:complete len:232 (-) Transcript_10489:103-798(-)